MITIALSVFLLWEVNALQAQIGQLTTDGDFTIESAGGYEVELKDLTGGGDGHDQIVTTANLDLDGTLDILLSGYTPVDTDNFDIITYAGSLTGSFATINWPDEMVSQGWSIDYGVLFPNTVTIYGNSVALPVEWMSFEVELKEGANILSWETAIEINNDYFSLEHSTDAINFKSVAIIPCKQDNSHLQEYSYTHKSSQSGNQYYRLMQVDLDDNYSYSNTVNVYRTKEHNEASFFPNPATNSITFDDVVSGLVIYNINGIEVINVNKPSRIFDISSLSSGTYIVKVKDASVLSERLIVTK